MQFRGHYIAAFKKQNKAKKVIFSNVTADFCYNTVERVVELCVA